MPQAAPRRARLYVRPTWGGTAGLKEVLAVMFPLVISNALNGLNLFLDRTFLAWYGPHEFAAAMQSGVTYWLVFSFFFAIVTYANTFVAQMHGAGIPRQIGGVIWQAIYLSVISGVVFAGIAALGYPLFRLIGHEGTLPRLEAEYFQVLAWGSIGGFLVNALYCFYAGRGQTGLVLFVTACVCLTNCALNVIMIFEPLWIFPDGIRGAAWATVLSQFVGVALYIAFMLARRIEYETTYALFSSWKLNTTLLKRVLRFAMPAGVHQTVEVLGFAVFLQVVGKFGFESQHATNMAMNINLLLFIPAVGLHIACSILAGQYCGAKNHDAVERLTFSAIAIVTAYMSVVICVYLFLPGPLLDLFRGGMDAHLWDKLFATAKTLLLVVAFYSLFDGVFLVYSGVLKGSGDTKFVMFMAMFFSIMVLTVPAVVLTMYRAQLVPRTGLLVAWGLCANYIVMLAFANLLRFRNGGWRSIDMIGDHSK